VPIFDKLPDLLFILFVAILVFELARWIRQARSFAQFATRDFSNVLSELEREVGTSREDFKEIASVIGGSTAVIANELSSASAEVRNATDSAKFDIAISAPTLTIPLHLSHGRDGGDGRLP
jgi:hypothetical protein